MNEFKVAVGSRVITVNGLYCAEYYCFNCKTVITSDKTCGCSKCNKLYNWDNIIPEK